MVYAVLLPLLCLIRITAHTFTVKVTPLTYLGINTIYQEIFYLQKLILK